MLGVIISCFFVCLWESILFSNGMVYLFYQSSKSDAWKKCMKSLISLLKERDFLVTFVRTLEAQGSFQMTDRYYQMMPLVFVTISSLYCLSVSAWMFLAV